jgi:predicted amidohydrolase YtcJ
MKHLVLLLVLTLVLLPRSNGEPSEPADTIFLNSNVYTVNDAQPQAEAIAIKGDRILFVGSTDAAKKYSGPATRDRSQRQNSRPRSDRLALSHFEGERLTHLNLESASSLKNFAKVKEGPRRQAWQWVTGRGWIETF